MWMIENISSFLVYFLGRRKPCLCIYVMNGLQALNLSHLIAFCRPQGGCERARTGSIAYYICVSVDISI